MDRDDVVRALLTHISYRQQRDSTLLQQTTVIEHTRKQKQFGFELEYQIINISNHDSDTGTLKFKNDFSNRFLRILPGQCSVLVGID